MRETLRSIDVPGAVATYKYEQTNGMADKMETERNAITATTPDEGGPGGITKCSPTCVPSNFAAVANYSFPSQCHQLHFI